MIQDYDGNNIKPIENSGCCSKQDNCTLPSASQNSEFIITNKNLKEAGYSNFNVIIKLLYSYVRENNILSLDSKENSSGVISLKNGKSFPIFYSLRGKHRCFSIIKSDIELFNIFLYENMPNNRMTLSQKPLCLDKEVPVLRDCMRQVLDTSPKDSYQINKLIYDACVNGERISYDKILVTINSDSTKPELKLIVNCRSFNGMICYALEKESIPKINEYFGFFSIKLLYPQKGEISFQSLNATYKRKKPYRYTQFKKIQEIINEKMDLARKADPSKTTHQIYLDYNKKSLCLTVYIRKWRDGKINYAIDKDSVEEIDKLTYELPKLDIKTEIPITVKGLRIFNDDKIKINYFILGILQREVKKRLQNDSQVTMSFGDGKVITFFYRYLKNIKVVAIFKRDKDKLLDFIKQEICQKNKFTLARKVKFLEDDVAITTDNFRKIFKISSRKASAKVKEILKMYEELASPTRVAVECSLLLPDGTHQYLTIGKRSNGIGTGRRYAFNKKDIPLLKYYFGYIDKLQYKKDLYKQQCKNPFKRFELLFDQSKELLRLCEVLTNQLKIKYEKIIVLCKTPQAQSDWIDSCYESLSWKNKQLIRQYEELTKNLEELDILYEMLIEQKEDFYKRYEKLVEQYKELIKKSEILTVQYNELAKLHDEIIKQRDILNEALTKKIANSKRQFLRDTNYVQFEATHFFQSVHSTDNVEIERATNIFQEKKYPTCGGITTILPITLNQLYITGSDLGSIIIWRNDVWKPLYIQERVCQLDPAMIRELRVLKNRIIVSHNLGIKILNRKEGCLDYYQSQELQFDVVPQCFTSFFNSLAQGVIYVYLPNKTIEVYRSEKELPFKFVGKISNLPIETNSRVKKIIALNKKRILMFFSSGEIYNLPLKENIQKEDVILVGKLDEKIKCVSNLFNDLLFIITKDKRGHWYRFNESYSTMDEEYSLRLKFLKGKNRVKNALLRDNVCYIYSTDKYGFNSDLLKITINY